eukprot:CAMPEP_0117662342 /NCGR_PEP_ID=MMETSP0804-20121206/8005_1 /TAXON_ID=1074897 /ORGANISM="Tetraselmis astigmatica, Strain CCMP880" /LENGTH=102 /DNA_ID=CAMNT_0005469241 /DNA_START=260 /DNA_END=568 /DNA_ORIENTATION=+
MPDLRGRSVSDQMQSLSLHPFSRRRRESTSVKQSQEEPSTIEAAPFKNAGNDFAPARGGSRVALMACTVQRTKEEIARSNEAAAQAVKPRHQSHLSTRNTLR